MENFIVFKGCHRATLDFRPIIFGGGEVLVRFRINTWQPQTDNVQLNEQINKLWGYSYSIWHKYNSERIGWRWGKQKDTLEVFSYRYIDGIRYTSQIGTYNINEWVEVKMFRPRFGYTLFPYFGGKEPSPVDIIFTLDVKKL